MRCFRHVGTVLVVLCVSGSVQAWESGKLRLRGRLQARFEAEEWTSRDLTESKWVSGFAIRRARMDARWQPLDWARLVLEFEGAGAVSLADRFGPDGEMLDVNRDFALQMRDAYGRFKVDEALLIYMGQFKKPFSRLRMESPFSLLVPVRGLTNRYAVNRTRYRGYGGRDTGAMVTGRFKDLARLTYHLGLFSGQRFNQLTETATRDYLARIQVRPFRGLRVAVNASHKVYHYKEGPHDTDLGLARGHAYTGNLFGADARFQRGNLTLILEGVFGDNVDLGPDHLMWGAHLTVAYAISLTDELTLTPAVMAEAFEEGWDGTDLAMRIAAAVNLDVGETCRFVLFGEGGQGKVYVWEPEERRWWPRPVDPRVFVQMQMAF